MSNRVCEPERLIKNCRICGSPDLKPVIDLDFQPWCNDFLKKEEIGKEPFYPLRVVYCHDCRAAQLDYTVPKEVMFADHTYLSGVTKSLSSHFKAVAEYVDNRFFKSARGKSALDIGSNDGTQLKYFKELGYEVLGVEPSKTIAGIAGDNGINTVNEFFNLDLARRLERKFHVVNAAGVFFHLEELHSAAEGIRETLRQDGVFVVQFLYMKQIMENMAFDQIYHEHLLYYNLHTIEALLERHGLGMFDAYLSQIHGGSIIGFITHSKKKQLSGRLRLLLQKESKEKSNDFSTYIKFAQQIRRMREKNLHYLRGAKQKGKKIFGFGAPVKGNTLLNYFAVGTEYIDCLVEKNRLRKGLYSPGMHIPVVMEDELAGVPDIYYVLAWNFKNEILQNNKNLLDKGVEFYFPVKPKGLE